MLRSRRRLRLRIALEFTLVALVANALLFMAVLAMLESRWRDGIDRDLAARASALGELAAAQLAAGRPVIIGEAPREPIAGSPPWFEIDYPNGNVLAEDPHLVEHDFPAAGIGQDPRHRTTEVRGFDGPFRVASIASREDGPRVVVHATASMSPMLYSLARLRGVLFYFCLPLATFTAGITAWTISDRVFRRITQVTRAAHDLRKGEPGARLPEQLQRDEIGDMVREMNAMIERLDAAFGAQRKFILDVTHELKTPVSVILAEAQVLAGKNPRTSSDRYEGFVSSVQEEMRRLGELLEGFLTLARTGHGETYVAPTLVTLNEAAIEAASRWEKIGKTIGTTLRLTLHESGDESELLVRGDHSLLVTMLENLLGAVSDMSGPKRMLELLVDRYEERVFVLVRPISESPLAARVMHNRGHELRIAIVRGIAQLHAGTVHTEGVEVRIELPLVHAGGGAAAHPGQLGWGRNV